DEYVKMIQNAKLYNYASNTCNAKVLKTDPYSKRSKAILDDLEDHYMKTNCKHAEKYVIIKLCEEINIQLISLANFEFFSSSIKDFEVYGSNELKPTSWSLLGSFTALNNKK